jgi:hypothetical protein
VCSSDLVRSCFEEDTGMTKRSVGSVVVLTIVTLGIYGIY